MDPNKPAPVVRFYLTDPPQPTTTGVESAELEAPDDDFLSEDQLVEQFNQMSLSPEAAARARWIKFLTKLRATKARVGAARFVQEWPHFVERQMAQQSSFSIWLAKINRLHTLFKRAQEQGQGHRVNQEVLQLILEFESIMTTV